MGGFVLKGNNKKGKIGIQDIAEMLNVSVSTVSRALNDHPHISIRTKEKVRQAAAKLGYHPGVPELMVPKKAEAVAVMTPLLKNSLYQEIILGLTDFFEQNRFNTFIIDIKNNNDNVSAFFDSYKKFGISGIIHIIGDRDIPDSFYSSVQHDGLPLVTIFEPDFETYASSVLPDIFQGIYKIVKYLHSLDVDHVALLLENDNRPEDFQIKNSFEVALDTLGMNKTTTSIIYTGCQRKHLEDATRQLFTKNDRPQAILVKSATAANEISKITNDLGFRFPKDFLLIALGMNNTDGVNENLSMLKFPAYQMGYEAAKMLMRQIRDKNTEKTTTVIPVSFILKGSAIRIEVV